MVLDNLKTKCMTRNDCYAANRKITPKGIMVHSTATPGVMAGAWFSRQNKSYKAGETNRQVCVHAFLDNEEIWQYLPWNHRGWHEGGAANNSHIGFEICEPARHPFQGATMVGYDVKKALEADKKPSPSPSQKLYRVQIGAYSVKANAEAQLARVKKPDFSDAFLGVRFSLIFGIWVQGFPVETEVTHMQIAKITEEQNPPAVSD